MKCKISCIVAVVLFVLSTAPSKELLTEEKINQLLTEKNPYIYTIFGKIPIQKGKIKYNLGNFDTKLKLTYEKKEYPLSSSLFYSFFLSQPLKNGIDINLGYRKAKGTQEYNNIKTGKDGELMFYLNIPVLKLINKTDERRLNLNLSLLNLNKVQLDYLDKLRKLKFKILKNYYKTIYYKNILTLEENLYKKALKRKSFIQKKVEVGALPEVSLIEAQQQLINRKQRVIKAKNQYENQLNLLLNYLNLSLEVFKEKYKLPEKLPVKIPEIHLEESIQKAKNQRPDLKIIEIEKEKLQKKQQYYKLLEYPDINLSLYGVHDFVYENGYKVVLNADFPFQRRKYLGKLIEIKKEKILLEKEKDKILLKIKTNIKNIINTIKTLQKNLEASKEELKLVKKLEILEKKKFDLGASNLFFINQREIKTLETEKKLLKTKLEIILNYKKYLMEINSL